MQSLSDYISIPVAAIQQFGTLVLATAKLLECGGVRSSCPVATPYVQLVDPAMAWRPDRLAARVATAWVAGFRARVMAPLGPRPVAASLALPAIRAGVHLVGGVLDLVAVPLALVVGAGEQASAGPATRPLLGREARPIAGLVASYRSVRALLTMRKDCVMTHFQLALQNANNVALSHLSR